MDPFPIISIIIPVFNVEPYLSKCIDSVLNQNFLNFEVLLINDGSTDNSGNICDEYSNKDSRVRVFHQKNKGVSSARNKGIKFADGYWICFVDADDWIEEKSFENIINCLSGNTKLDMVIAKSYLNNTESPLVEKYPFKKEWITECCEGIKLYIENEYMRWSVCGVLFRKDFIIKHEIYFPLNISNGEDSIFVIMCNIYAKCVYFVDVHFYNVFERKGSASRNWSFERTITMVNNISYLNHYLKTNSDLSLEAKNILNHGKFAAVSKIYSKLYGFFSFNKYITLRSKIKNEINEKIITGDIKSGKNYVKLLNFSQDVFALIILAKTAFNKSKIFKR